MRRRTRRRGRGPPTRSRARRSRRRARSSQSVEVREKEAMRKTITGTGGMLLHQSLNDPGVASLFSNPGSAGAGRLAAHPGTIPVATTRAPRQAPTPPTGPVYLAISADLRLREGLEAQIGEAAGYRIERPGPARAKTVEEIARRLGAAQCPVLMFGDD